MRFPLLIALAALGLSACVPRLEPVSSLPAPAERPVWAFEGSDVAPDPAFRFGRLDNGMRFVIRRNATPAGTALVRMEVAAGSLSEGEDERGFAHFVEHMAFNGSTRVPEGEMVRLLEREGLAFGADTNAQTTFDRTTYLLDLPRAEDRLLDTALMLMREAASELTFSPEAVERERGVILAERRDRNTFAFRNLESQIAFAHPEARYTRRLPIGRVEAITAATAESLRAFWQREYVPERTTVIVVGDFDPDAVEAAIRKHFASWAARPPAPAPLAGPVLPDDKGRTAIHLDPALSERITASRNGAWLDERDTVAQREENVLRQIGYGIVNRRLQRLSRAENPPFRAAGFGTGPVFREGRATNLVVDTVDGRWRRGLIASVLEYRRAMAQGFTEAEIAEQVANLQTSARNLAASAQTRSHSALVEAVYALLREDLVPAHPQSSLDRLEALIGRITPDAVLAALKREAVPLTDPLLRFQGRQAPRGGERAIRRAWTEAMALPLGDAAAQAQGTFAYTDFGPPGTVASDTVEPLLGIRQVRFANAVRLNLKRTELEKDRVAVQLSLDGGDFLNTRDQPLATAMVGHLPTGGLGQHSQDELQSLLAGRSVAANLASTPETFVATASTTPRDLELQLQLMTAMIVDPGYRREGEVRYRQTINTLFEQLRATPQVALSNALGGILSDNDPRFTLQPVESYRALTFSGLRDALSERLANGAIEIGVVGDIDEEATIVLVARTLGALPAREPDFRPWEDRRTRPFTTDRSPRVIRHTGPADQALLRHTWPTRDDSDEAETHGFDLLERVVRIALTESLRERLGKAYSPSAASNTSQTWRGYGTFALATSVDVTEVPAARAAIAETLAALRDAPVSADLLQRARQPLIERHDNALKSNRGWMALVDRAQTEADRIARFLRVRDGLMAVTPEQLQALARRYLRGEDGVEVLVMPEGVEVPAR